MKVFGCRMQGRYAGGIVLVAAASVEEAYETAAQDKKLSYYFYPEPGASQKRSDEYPKEKWCIFEHLSTDLTSPQVILEAGYSE